jgi:presenilin-like A22 family membrane protease
MRAGWVPRGQRIALRLSRHLPEPLLAQPERIFINVAAILLGLAALVPPPGGIADQWPYWFRLEWAGAMVLAGVAAVHGTWTGYRPTERLGAGLFSLGAAAYGLQAAITYDWGATGTVLIFVFLSLAKALRVIRSLAVTASITESIRDRGTGADQADT